MSGPTKYGCKKIVFVSSLMKPNWKLDCAYMGFLNEAQPINKLGPASPATSSVKP